MKYFYGILAFLGVVLPYSQFLPWIIQNGLDMSQLVEEITQTRIGSFAWMDVLVSAIVLIGFILFEGKRNGMRSLWLPIIGTLVVGVSLGLPLFLLLREIHIVKKLQG
ncbi:DUF2834 domain-containing protein [Paenibacillus allorhizosphaerae]|uniref:DUF2834 domain-containing protein n=1 Tax=Paenibacillus allorhizosphaerae TaxID=2849866 RepID=A0ABN7U1Q1_9BACL|nr:DUF2834 domain-containing protein [Paenibacillus allorhizosphaerae]CAG7658901.1 hypothetical protein PAECIP111802_07210 [Paenibacillus allorhizosphaerae]